MVLSSSQLDGAEARYAHILQPIKDLTKNWDVDIAAYLEDYLEELEHTTISFDGGVTTMNFAQAALLVQSTACVYSKKVEYLYSLVHNVLEMLANKKKQAQKSSVDDEGNDADADFHDDDDDDQFLSLDDMQESKNLNLKEDFDAGEEFRLLPEIPLCLIPLEEGEKGENPLLSKTGEVLASRNDFKMNTCGIHPQGTLLLDMSHLKLLEESIKILAELQEKCKGEQMNGDVEMRSTEEALPDAALHDLPGGDGDHDDDSMGDEVDGGPPLGDNSVHQSMETEHEVVGQDNLRRSARNKQKLAQYVAKPIVDPWKYLDPHEEIKVRKPMSKKGKIHKLCPGIEEKSKKRKRDKELPPVKETLSRYIERSLYSPAHKFPKNQLKVPTFQEFERQYWEEFKRRQAVQREQLKKRREENAVDNVDDDDNEENDDNIEIAPLPDVMDDDIDDLVDDNLLNAIDNAVRSNEDYISDQTQKSFAERVDEGIIVNSYEDLVRKHVEEYMASAQEYAQITDLSRRVSEWEDKVLPKLEEEETHRPFDINTYGSSVIDNLDSTNKIKFKRLVQGKPVYEICRMFLASLMLANTTNVKIQEKGELEEGMDRFELELMSRKRHFEHLQEYTAPSLSQK